MTRSAIGSANPCRRLIVHADDLGISESVNSAIKEAHVNGVVTSASIMAVGAAFGHAVDICRSLPELDIGVHLTLIEERPLLPVDDVPSLVTPGGNFHESASAFTRRYFLRQLSLREVYLELDAQIRHVVDTGLSVSHLDSHQHIHMLPGIFDVTIILAEKYGIPAVRIPHEKLRLNLLLRAPSLARTAQQLVLGGFCLAATRRMGSVRRTDHFAGFLFGGAMNRENIQRVLKNLPPDGCIELMCHPNLSSSDGLYDHWNYDGAGELEALIDPTLPKQFDDLGIQLISYANLER